MRSRREIQLTYGIFKSFIWGIVMWHTSSIIATAIMYQIYIFLIILVKLQP